MNTEQCVCVCLSQSSVKALSSAACWEWAHWWDLVHHSLINTQWDLVDRWKRSLK